MVLHEFYFDADMVKFVSDHAILAEVDGQLWDMHRPLTSDVECLKFLHFKEVCICIFSL